GSVQGHADVVSAVCSHDLDVGEAIAERRTGSARCVRGKNRITAGRDVDLQVAAFCRKASVLLSAPLQYLAAAVGDVDEIRFLVIDVTSIAKARHPNVEFC